MRPVTSPQKALRGLDRCLEANMSASKLPLVVEHGDGSFSVTLEGGLTIAWRFCSTGCVVRMTAANGSLYSLAETEVRQIEHGALQ
jgi:hypothetical protein